MQTNTSETPITVGIVDNDTLTLAALRTLLNRMNGMTVAWTVGNGNHAIDLCLDPHTRPNVLLVDLSMEPIPGTEICHRIRTAGIPLGVVCITSFTLQTYAAQAAATGAQAIVSKTDLPGMQLAIHQAAQGHASPSPVVGITFHNVNNTANTANPVTHDTTGTIVTSENLPSERELQIIRMLANGMETDEISQSLTLSRYTVTTYIKRACNKLGARNRTNLIAICERRGLL